MIGQISMRGTPRVVPPLVLVETADGTDPGEAGGVLVMPGDSVRTILVLDRVSGPLVVDVTGL